MPRSLCCLGLWRNLFWEEGVKCALWKRPFFLCRWFWKKSWVLQRGEEEGRLCDLVRVFDLVLCWVEGIFGLLFCIFWFGVLLWSFDFWCLGWKAGIFCRFLIWVWFFLALGIGVNWGFSVTVLGFLRFVNFGFFLFIVLGIGGFFFFFPSVVVGWGDFWGPVFVISIACFFDLFSILCWFRCDGIIKDTFFRSWIAIICVFSEWDRFLFCFFLLLLGMVFSFWPHIWILVFLRPGIWRSAGSLTISWFSLLGFLIWKNWLCFLNYYYYYFLWNLFFFFFHIFPARSYLFSFFVLSFVWRFTLWIIGHPIGNCPNLRIVFEWNLLRSWLLSPIKLYWIKIFFSSILVASVEVRGKQVKSEFSFTFL